VLYTFDGIDERLDLIPVAARRALDLAGLKLSLDAWRTLSLADREQLASLGAKGDVDPGKVAHILRGVSPVAQNIVPVPDPPPDAVPSSVVDAFGPERPVDLGVWGALSPLDRYALAKVARKPRPERIDGAYREIVGHSAASSHVAPGGGVRMVDVGQKQATLRRAVTTSRLTMNAEAFGRLARADVPKGDVLSTARVAGIMAAKKTSDLIPLCHPLQLTHIGISLTLDEATRAVDIEATVETMNRTGVEMEALVAASTAALTVYDMLKAFDRAMVIGPTQLLAKSGGRSGDYRR
jgi:molybdenum cofactor biosynthesis protein MoaC